jgi:hypothetical protein
MYDGRAHTAVGGPNVINVFSFSKVRLAAPMPLCPGGGAASRLRRTGPNLSPLCVSALLTPRKKTPPPPPRV